MKLTRRKIQVLYNYYCLYDQPADEDSLPQTKPALARAFLVCWRSDCVSRYEPCFGRIYVGENMKIRREARLRTYVRLDELDRLVRLVATNHKPPCHAGVGAAGEPQSDGRGVRSASWVIMPAVVTTSTKVRLELVTIIQVIRCPPTHPSAVALSLFPGRRLRS